MKKISKELSEISIIEAYTELFNDINTIKLY